MSLVDTDMLAIRATLEPPQLEALSELSFSPDGSFLVTTCTTNRVQLWNLSALWRELEALGLDGTR